MGIAIRCAQVMSCCSWPLVRGVKGNTGGRACAGCSTAGALSMGFGVRCVALLPAPQVRVVEGDLKDLLGRVRAVLEDGRVEVMPSMKDLDEVLTFDPGQLAKYFQARARPTIRVVTQAEPLTKSQPPPGYKCYARNQGPGA